MEHRRDRSRLLLAILASILLHLAVGISLASFGDRFTPPPPKEEDKPVELTFVDLAPTPVPAVAKNAPFIDTPEKRESKEAPKEKTFESNANSIAASQLPALGDAPVPTQDGKDRPGIEVENQRYALASQNPPVKPEPVPSATPPPTPPPTPVPTATPTPVPSPSVPPTPPPVESPTPNEELMAMFRATPPPTMRDPEEIEATPAPEVATPPPTPRPTPAQPRDAFRREERQNKMVGNISNRGITSLNAIGTPLGRYTKELQDAVGSRWYQYVESRRDLVSIGTVRVRFFVDRFGKVQSLKMMSNTSNEAFGNLCLESVQEIKMPPIPDDLANTLPSEGLEEELTFTIYPN